MKNLVILVLVLGLAAALFLSKPQKADFEKFARDNKLTDTQPGGGPTVAQTIAQKMQNFAGTNISFESPTDSFLKKCTYNNNLLWTNVQENGQTLYTGVAGHWFQRGPSVAPAR